ncbi:MAG: NUDIX domain-containing protein [Brevinematia bacterium]|jgi:ADP-ribose pyrophosphatase YjhB (NUDIX family)
MIRIRVQGLIFDREGRILLVKHVKNGLEYYVLPGGGLEYRETLIEGLSRELKEELNIREIFSAKLIDLREFIDSNSDRHVIDIYFYVNANIEEVKLSEEDGILKGFDFFSLENLSKVTVYPSEEFIKHLVELSVGKIIKK